MSFAACCQNYDLVELQASRFSEPQGPQVGKLLTQQPRAFGQSHLRNYKQQDSSDFEPTIGMFQKDGFQSLIVAFSGLPVVRRIEVEQGHCFRRAPHIHRVGLQGFDSEGFRLFCTVGVYLNSIAIAGHVLKQMGECRAIPDTRVER